MLKKLLFISLVISIIVNINNLSAETTILVPLKKPSLTDEEIVKKLTQNILLPIKKPALKVNAEITLGALKKVALEFTWHLQQWSKLS